MAQLEVQSVEWLVELSAVLLVLLLAESSALKLVHQYR